MKKMIPVYLLLAAILTVGILLLRKAEAMRTELAGIRSEQFKQPTGKALALTDVVPVRVVGH